MKERKIADKTAGVLLCIVTVLVICQRWSVAEWSKPVTPFLMLAIIAIFTVQIRRSRQVFVLIGCVLSIALAATNPNWFPIIANGLATTAFIAAFFSALSTLRTVAQQSLAIQAAGAFLAEQKPSRRYAALTLGGQAFTLLLNYGAIQLLGPLAVANAKTEPNREIQNLRIKRMLLAIQRAFVASMPWSPLSFAMAVSLSVIPGASWTQVLVPGMMSSLILVGIGWGLDTFFQPRLTVKPTRAHSGASSETWAALLPLITLLAVLVVGVIVLHEVAGEVPITGLVALLVPLIALVWTMIQHRTEAPLKNTWAQVKDYALHELPSYRGEMTLLMMAGFIGTVGSHLLAPLMTSAQVDLSVIPSWLVIVSFVWILPLAGQIGMNPILTVTLIAPLIPEAAELGVQSTALVLALTAGWALSGASSPFTATTLLIGSFAEISASRVGLIWNGVYTILGCLTLSAWVLVYSFLL